jgi:RNA-directed DNA polymerase
LEAFKEVKANRGAAGVDLESIEAFEKNLKDNLYKLWNRMTSGSYFPPSVRGVPIPKKSGGTRMLGVPTVADRVAQTVVKMTLEPILDPIFDENSFGYRPKKSALDAVGVTRQRCWKYDWVVEFDIKGLFDNIDHGMLMKALRKHCDCRWVLLYVERWLKAPMQLNGQELSRDKGTPQGGVVSPLLANLFLHYAFDVWVRREMLNVPFCRYADDGLLHCRSKKQAEYVMQRIAVRFRECKLEIHPDKSKIVYCKDRNRKEEHPIIKFDFLGYTFKPRRCVDKKGNLHSNYLPAISGTSKKAIHAVMRGWHVQLKTDKELYDIAHMFNPILRGWFLYYGKFYPSDMQRIWRRFNRYLVQWTRRKYKRFAKHVGQARQHIKRLAKAQPNLFVHWRFGAILAE